MRNLQFFVVRLFATFALSAQLLIESAQWVLFTMIGTFLQLAQAIDFGGRFEWS